MLSRSSGEVKFDGSSCMKKPVYFAFFKTMLQFFANYTFCYITSTFAKTKEKNNRDDGFETRHFDEGRPCGEPPCTSLVQRSRMLMQKRPLLAPPCISPSKYKYEKNSPLNRPSEYKPPGGGTWKIALKYKVKQSKN